MDPINDKRRQTKNELICRICSESTIPGLMVSPCGCSEDQIHIHYKCLKSFVEDSGLKYCLICGQKWIGFKVREAGKCLADFAKEEDDDHDINMCYHAIPLDDLSNHLHWDDNNVRVIERNIYPFIYLLFNMSINIINYDHAHFQVLQKLESR